MAEQNWSSLPDERLVELAREGEEAAFNELYQRYREKILRFSYTILHNYEDCWDVLQETWLYIFKKLPSYRPEAKFGTLLFKVVRSLSLSLYHKKYRQGVLSEEVLDQVYDEGTPPELALERQEEVHQIRKVLFSLPSPYREILYLNVIEGLEYAEIAEIMGCPLGTVKSRLHYGWKKLESKLWSQSFQK